MQFSILFLLAASWSMVYYVDSTYSDTDITDCTVRISPCASIPRAYATCILRGEADNVILLDGPGSLRKTVDMNIPLRLTGNMENPTKIQHTLSFSFDDRREDDYRLGIQAAVQIDALSISIGANSMSLQWFSVPAIVVGSEGSLTLQFVTISQADPSSLSSYLNRQAPLIDSTAGTLTLIAAEFSDFVEDNCPLLEVSVEKDKFDMQMGTVIKEDDDEDDDAEVVPCVFDNIKRVYGNGTVFHIALSDNNVFHLHNVQFTSCTATGVGSCGGAVYLDVGSASASFSFANIELDKDHPNDAVMNGSTLYVVLPSAPKFTDFQMFFNFWEDGRVFAEKTITIEYPSKIMHVSEIPSHIFLSYQSRTDEDCGTYSTPCETLKQTPNYQYIYLKVPTSSSSPYSAVTAPLTYSKAGVILTAFPISPSSSYLPRILFNPITDSTAPLVTIAAGSDVTFNCIETTVNDDLAVSLFSVAGTLNLVRSEIDAASRELSTYLIAATGTLNITRTTISGGTLTKTSLLNIGTATLVTSEATFRSITRNAGCGAVIEETIKTGTLTLTGCTFDTCTASGNGGAVALTIEGGAVTLAGTEESSLVFTNCRASGGTQGEKTFDGDGGAVWVTMTGGTLNIEGTYSEDSREYSLSFASCTVANAGGAIYVASTAGTISFSTFSASSCTSRFIYLSLNGVPSLSFSSLSLSGLSDSTTSGGYVYVTTTKEDWIKSKWEDTWKGLVADRPSCSDRQYMIAVNDALLQNIFELEPATLFVGGSTTTNTASCGTYSLPCSTVKDAAASDAYKTPSQVKIYIRYHINEDSQLSFDKAFLNISSISSNSPKSLDLEAQYTMVSEGGTSDYQSKGALITIAGGEAVLHSLSLSPKAVNSMYINTILELSSNAKLTLEKVTITPDSTYSSWNSIVPVNAESGTLILRDTKFQSLRLEDTPLLKVSLSQGGFVTEDCTFDSITRTSSTDTKNGGSVLDVTVGANKYLTINHATFKDCKSPRGGAMSIVVDGGSVVIAPSDVEDEVSFISCYSTQESGGALYIEVKSGSFQLGKVAETKEESTQSNDDDDEVEEPFPVLFSGCYIDYQQYPPKGGAIYISTSSLSSLTFGRLCALPDTSSTASSTLGTFLYITSPQTASGLSSIDWASSIYYNDYDTSSSGDRIYSFDLTKWVKRGYYVAYDETSKTYYDLYTVGGDKISVERESSDSSTTLYCGFSVPCKTLEAALVTIPLLLHTPTTIEVSDTYKIDTDSEELKFLYPLTLQGSTDERNDTIIVVSSSYYDGTNTHIVYISMTILADVSVTNLALRIDDDLSHPIFQTKTGGSLHLLNVLVTSSTDSDADAYLFELSQGTFTSADCEFKQINVEYPIFNISSSSGAFALSNTNNFTNLHGDGCSPVVHAIINGSSDHFLLSSASFTNCTGTAANGGAVCVSMYEGSLSLKNVAFTNCSAPSAQLGEENSELLLLHLLPERFALATGGYGGALYIDIQQNDTDKLNFDFDSVSFSRNTAQQSGNSVYMTVSKDSVLKDKAFKNLVPDDDEEGIFTYAVVNTSYSAPLVESKELSSRVYPGLSTGAIVGIVIGCVAFVAIIVALVICLLYHACPLYKCIHSGSSSSGSSSSSSSTSSRKVEAQEMEDQKPVKVEEPPASSSAEDSSDSSAVQSQYPSSE